MRESENFGSRSDYVVLLGKCDEVVRDLCKQLGWEELDESWAKTEASVLTEPVKGAEDEGESGDTKVDDEQAEEAKTQTLLETIEARLAKIAITAEIKIDAHKTHFYHRFSSKEGGYGSIVYEDDVEDQKDHSSATK